MPEARPFQVMVLGTGSHSGKSLVAAGLCRILSDRGFRVAPFKAQNMALNSVVTPEGLEIGQAQALQAQAARVLPRAAMNPVLLKPLRGRGSQVIVLGKPVGYMTTRAYFRWWPRAAKAAQRAWASLAAEHEALVIEGAGSPAEVNLAHRDLANLETARFSKAPWILVADIERGGSFAAVTGTLALVPKWLRARCLGVVFNKFRGDASLMGPGLAWLKRRGVRTLGVVPWMDGLALAQEDSLGLPSSGPAARGRGLRIEVLRHASVANFNDALPLAGLPGASLAWSEPGRERPQPDLLILPGSKDTLADLEALWATGEARRILAWHAKGTRVLGLCGGFQMLGRFVEDAGHDSGRRGRRRARGLGLLDMKTRMAAEKVLVDRRGRVATPWGRLEVAGYEIHHGRTRLGRAAKVAVAGPDGSAWLVSDARGRAWGSYLHGLLDNLGLRSAFLASVARARGRRPPAAGPADGRLRERSLHAWARHLVRHLDLGFLPERP